MVIAKNILRDIDFCEVLIKKLTFWSAVIIRIVDYFNLKNILKLNKARWVQGSYKLQDHEISVRTSWTKSSDFSPPKEIMETWTNVFSTFKPPGIAYLLNFDILSWFSIPIIN